MHQITAHLAGAGTHSVQQPLPEALGPRQLLSSPAGKASVTLPSNLPATASYLAIVCILWQLMTLITARSRDFSHLQSTSKNHTLQQVRVQVTTLNDSDIVAALLRTNEHHNTALANPRQ
jgi:hypothetical protein